jgi:hypothetical protein
MRFTNQLKKVLSSTFLLIAVCSIHLQCLLFPNVENSMEEGNGFLQKSLNTRTINNNNNGGGYAVNNNNNNGYGSVNNNNNGYGYGYINNNNNFDGYYDGYYDNYYDGYYGGSVINNNN